MSWFVDNSKFLAKKNLAGETHVNSKALQIVKTTQTFRLSRVFCEFLDLRKSQNCPIVSGNRFRGLPETIFFGFHKYFGSFRTFCKFSDLKIA